MNYKVVRTELVEKQIKQLQKKYRTFETDVTQLESEIQRNYKKGTQIRNFIYKIRFVSKSKKSGKSGGFRAVYVVSPDDEIVVMAFVYDKSEMDDISDSVLENIVVCIDCASYKRCKESKPE